MTQTYTQMDFQSVLTERIKYVARVNETKTLEEESKNTPHLVFECAGIDTTAIAQQTREKAELDLQNFDLEVVKNFPNGRAMLQLLKDVEKLPERQSLPVKNG